MTAGFAIAIADVADDAAALGRVRGVVGIGQGAALGVAKPRFDRVEPGRIRRGVDQVNAEPPTEPLECGMIVHIGQIVENDIQRAAAIAAAETAKGGAELDDALPFDEVARETVGVHVEEAEEVLHAMRPVIRGAHPMRPAAARPRTAAHGFHFQRPPLVEADHRGARRAAAVEGANGVFFDQTPGRPTSSTCARAAASGLSGAATAGPTHP